MALQEKYAQLVGYVKESGAQDLSVIEKDNVLYVTAKATGAVKNKAWEMYSQIDPEMRAGDLVLNIDVIAGGEEIYEIKPGDSLSKIAAKYPGMTWQKIAEANKDVIKDPNMIHPGEKIVIPS